MLQYPNNYLIISISEKYATWDHAQTLCSNIGGYLAEIKTIGEHVFLVNIFQSKLKNRLLPRFYRKGMQ